MLGVSDHRLHERDVVPSRHRQVDRARTGARVARRHGDYRVPRLPGIIVRSEYPLAKTVRWLTRLPGILPSKDFGFRFFPKDFPEDFPEDFPRDFPNDCPKDFPKYFRNDFPKDFPKDLPKECPKDFPKDFPKNVS